MALLKDGIYGKSGQKHPAFWQSVLEKLKVCSTSEHYESWLLPLEVVSYDSKTLTLLVPSAFFQMFIRNKFEKVIIETVKLVTGNSCNVEYSVGEISEEATELSSQGDSKLSSDNSTSEKNATNEDIFSTNGFDSLITDTGLIKTSGRYIDTRHTFDNFIVGVGNQFAFAAAKGVALSPGDKHNPLLIYGPSGLGKTHLLHSIAIQVYKQNPNAKICYLSAESFVNDFINSTQKRSMDQFQGRYRRNFDIFLIDDIQFFATKERSQEEFFHTFNHLCESHFQVVMTSDKAPKELSGLQDRLITRVQQGLIVDIKPPDLETRIAILRAKAWEEDLYLPDDVGLMIASNIKSNIRELEGCLVRLGAEVSINGSEITMDMAREALADIFDNNRGDTISVDAIKQSVSQYYKISVSDLVSKSRIRKFAQPRQLAMFLCRKYGAKTYADIASDFGGKDHSTVIHAIRKIEKSLETDSLLKKQYEEIQQFL